MSLVVETHMVPVYVVLVVPPTLAGVAVVIAAVRAKKDDLPEIVRALMRVEPRDDKRHDDSAKPPALPKP
jgi:hypothetical protein